MGNSEAFIEDEFESHVNAPQDGVYQSPVLARMQGSQKLTLATLERDIPLFQAGRAAEQRLQDAGGISEDELDQIERDIRAGNDAKERMVFSGIPLVKFIAHKEYTRRRGWQSSVTFEELIQEGTIGLLRGLTAYKLDSGQRSPVNYLGQWILIEMRRNVETLDNDITVAYEASDRFRKIRAIRSRLYSELGRDPTDEEILEASDDPAFNGGSKLGRVKKNPDAPKRNPLTAKHLDDERNYRETVGSVQHFLSSDEANTGYSGAHPQEDAAQNLYQPDRGLDQDEVDDEDARSAVGRLIQMSLDLMQLPAIQREIVSRRYGLPPFPAEQSGRDIATSMNVQRIKVGKVIDAFTDEMSRPGGMFHKACASLDKDELIDLGLGWTLTVLGDYHQVPENARRIPVAAPLTEPLGTRSRTVAPPPAGPENARSKGEVRAQFECEYHGWGFVGIYAKREDVPKNRDCPRCGKASPLIRVMQM